MRRSLIIICIFIVLAFAAYRYWPHHDNRLSENQSCGEQIPFGKPVSLPNKSFQTLCHLGYLTHLDTDARIADWSVYTLTPEHARGVLPRSNAFAADPMALLQSRVRPEDYEKSEIGSFDRGHSVPAEDLRWDQQVERNSYLMTNMTPQRPYFNRVTWKKLEVLVHRWSIVRNDSLTVYVGPIYDLTKDYRIANSIDVPEGFYKIVIDDRSHETLAFLYRDQEQHDDLSPSVHLTTVEEIEKLTKIHFPLPNEGDRTKVSVMWEVPRHH